MPFVRPTLSELQDRAEADLASRMGLSALLRRGTLWVLSRLIAGAAHGLHGRADFLARQLMPDTADVEHLDRWAGIYGVTRKAATPSAGTVTFTGTDAAVIPAGTRLRRVDSLEVETQAEGTISAGTASVAVEAVDPGVAGNTAAGAELDLVSPIAGIDDTATVDSPGLSSGAERETDAALRTRVLQQLQERPQGGSKADYIGWALSQPGITRAWCLPAWYGGGTVGLTCATDDAPGGPIPDAGTISDLQTYVDGVRPVTAQVFVFAPTEVTLDPTIQLTPDTQVARAAVEASLEDLLRREAEPGATLYLSHIKEAISTAPGEVDHTLVSPTADVVASDHELITLGTVTWQ